MNVSESSDLVIGEVFSTAADNMVGNEGTDLSPTIKCRMCDKCWPQNTKWGRQNLIMYTVGLICLTRGSSREHWVVIA